MIPLPMVGNRYAKLVVLSLFDKIDRKHTLRWNCKCDCGNLTIVRGNDLRAGKIKSCGSNHHPCGQTNPRWRGCGDLSHSYFKSLERNATRRNISFGITIEYAWHLFLKQNKRCAISGEILTFSTARKVADGTASLDRVDNTKGYIEDNVQWVHKVVNYMKWTHLNEDLILWCKKIAHFNEQETKSKYSIDNQNALR